MFLDAFCPDNYVAISVTIVQCCYTRYKINCTVLAYVYLCIICPVESSGINWIFVDSGSVRLLLIV